MDDPKYCLKHDPEIDAGFYFFLQMRDQGITDQEKIYNKD